MSDLIERRAYGRGYTAGMRRIQKRLDRVIEIAKGIRTRANSGMGVCADCRYFQRQADMRWGACDVANHGEPSWEIPSHRPSWFGSADGRLSVHVGEGFGCLHWGALKARAKGAAS